ncbi:hypothetical protein ACGF8B_19565 [Streptomyces sp. NPDC047917]|uniref:hypothetical protein n=1 Tax=Streptomyces sp. NPDC047917 TaxID=3365491 RepID=UPI00371B8A88
MLSALTGVAGLLLGFLGLPVVFNSPTARAPIPQPTVTVTATATAPQAPADNGPPPASGDPSPSTEPVTKNGIRMPDRFNLLLSDNPIKLHEGYGGDLSYYLQTGLTSKQGKLVRLDPGADGSRAECESDTRYTDAVDDAQLTKGSKVCVLSNDHVALVTIRAAPEERDGSYFVTFDIIVWQ